MRYHLLTVEGTQQFDEMWRIVPSVPLRSLPPKLMMPMAGEEIELRLPDGRVATAVIARFGVDAWKDNEGNLFISTDPSDPSLTLTITCGSDVGEVPSGTEIWLPNVRSDSTSEAL